LGETKDRNTAYPVTHPHTFLASLTIDLKLLLICNLSNCGLITLCACLCVWPCLMGLNV